MRRIARTAADGVGATEWLEMGGEKKQPLVMSDLGCADGCGREKGAENCADGCGWRGCNGVAGNYGCEEEAAGDERAWLRGRLRTANGWGELRGRLQTAWVPGSGWKLVGRRSRWRSASLAARTAADGKWVRRIARTAADGVGNGRGEEAAGDQRAWLRGRLRTAWVQRSGWKWVGRRNRWRSASLGARTAADGKWVRRTARTAADGVGATEWLEMGGEKTPLVMSELGCVAGADGKWVRRIARTAADGVAAGNGLGTEAAGDERAWLRGRLRTANGWGELRGRLRLAWVPGSGWKLVGRRSRW